MTTKNQDTANFLASMHQPSAPKPGDRLVEVELAEKFEVSRQPVREALLALQKEGTVIMNPYKGAMVKPLSVAEVEDIAGLRLALISGRQTSVPSPLASRL
jgi:DNA-binding FadR family transcriptional regulator